jgi:predicted phosphodiesterase
MIYAILGDIHANLEALEAVIQDAQEQAVSCYLCTGDIVGYNAEPSACLAKLNELNARFVKGNHDHYCSTSLPLHQFNPLVRDTLQWTRKKLSVSEKKQLKQAPYKLEIDNFTLVHSSLHHPDQWNYVFDLQAAKDHFRNQFSQICFIGHSHIPTAFIKNGQIEQGDYNTLSINKDYRYLINVGSVGQPRDRNPDAAYVIYNRSLNKLELRRVSYNRHRTKTKIREAGLPFRNALRLERGR